MSSTSTTSRSVRGWDISQQEHATLRSLGFTPEQIRRLVKLRALYPLIEEVYTREEAQRLLFLKWLHEHWSGDSEFHWLEA